MSTNEQSMLEMATELVQAQIQAGHIVPEDMHQVLANTHAQLMDLRGLSNQRQTGVPPVRGPSFGASEWRKSITQHVITCLECGAVYKQLSKRHLRQHDMNPQSYRRKYGIPRTMALAGRETTARRRKAVQETRPWEKTPRYLEAQAAAAAASASKKHRAAAKSRQ